MLGHILSLVFHALTDGYFYAGVALGVAAHVAVSRLVARIEHAILSHV